MEAVRFLVIYTNALLFLSAISVANRVNQINELLLHPRWSDLRLGNKYVGIIERWMDSEEHFGAHDLLAEDPPTQMVTEENAETKIRQAQLFFSCHYAEVVKKFSDLQRGVVSLCRRMTEPYESLQCLNEFIEVIKDNDTIVLHMQASLLWFDQLSPTTRFLKDVSEILADFKSFCDNKTVDSSLLGRRVSDNAVLSTVHAECTAIEQYMSTMVQRLSAFYYSFCRPIAFRERVQGISDATAYVQHTTENEKYAKFVSYRIVNNAKEVINTFLESDFEDFGFRYDRSSNVAQVVSYDPDQMRRVKQMNMLLSHDGWKSMGKDGEEINVINKSEDHIITRVDELLRFGGGRKRRVTKDNVNTKTILAHHFLSCKYATVLKECCDFILAILNQSESELSDTIHRLPETMENVNSLVMRLRSALSYVYQMSPPDIEYNIAISHFLEDFKGFCDRTTFEECASDDNLIIRENIRDVVGFVKIYFGQSCDPYDYHMERISPSLIDAYGNNVIEKFQLKINELKKSAFSEFGFVYDPVLNIIRLI